MSPKTVNETLGTFNYYPSGQVLHPLVIHLAGTNPLAKSISNRLLSVVEIANKEEKTAIARNATLKHRILFWYIQ